MPCYVEGYTNFQRALRRSQRNTASSPCNSRLAESSHSTCHSTCRFTNFYSNAWHFNSWTRGVAKILFSCGVLLSVASLRIDAQALPADRAPVAPMLVAPTPTEPIPAAATGVALAPAEPAPVAPSSVVPVAFKFSFERSALLANLIDRSTNAIHIEPPPLDNRRAERIRRPFETSSTRRFLLLSAGVYAFALLDIHETASMRDAVELDPLARPFTNLPKPAYYASGVALATTVNVSAWVMARSPRWHHVWWVPQACAMAGNLWGFASTKARE